MHIVLPGALPDPAAAKSLLPHLLQTAPTLVAWMSYAHAQAYDVPAQPYACTPEEFWQLHLAGYPPGQGNHAAGLGPLLAAQAGLPNDQPIWLAELVHMAPTQHGAALMTADELSITDDQSQALLDSLLALGPGDFTLHPYQPQRWLVTPPDGFTAHLASPALVARTGVDTWWPHEDAAKSWRRFFNEIQMTWHAHPANQQRTEQGLHPINGLWLFGGASLDQFSSPVRPDAHWHATLLTPWQRQDWAGWLQALSQLESQVFAPLAASGTHPHLSLTGHEKIIRVVPRTGPAWLHRMLGHNNQWRTWWSPQT